MKVNIIIGLILTVLPLSHNALGKELQLTCHSLSGTIPLTETPEP